MSQLERTRVLVVDDHPALRKGIVLCLQSFDDMEVVAETASGEQAILLGQALAPDVVLMDVRMPGIGGIAATRILCDTCADTRVIALTAYEEGTLVEEVIQAGAIGCLLKDVLADDLAKAIRQAHRGMPVLGPGAAQALVRAVQSRPPDIGRDLSQREREVLGLLTEGRSNPSIAEHLVVTTATVKFHIRSIRAKLGTTNRTEMAVLALRHHLGKLPENDESSTPKARTISYQALSSGSNRGVRPGAASAGGYAEQHAMRVAPPAVPGAER